MFDVVVVPRVAWHIMSLPISSTAGEGNNSCSGDHGGKKPADLV